MGAHFRFYAYEDVNDNGRILTILFPMMNSASVSSNSSKTFGGR